VVIAGDHVLRAQIYEGKQTYAADFLDVALVALGDGVRQGLIGRKRREQKCAEHKRN
jgi:hypothetical protein